MTKESVRKSVPLRSLGSARATAHKAVQLATKAARANLDAVPDDSHSNLGWDRTGKRFVSQPIPSGDGDCLVAVSFGPLTLGLVRGAAEVASLDLDNVTDSDAMSWLDAQLEAAGLAKASGVELPYDLPEDVEAVQSYRSSKHGYTLDVLSEWFDFAAGLLSRFASENAHLTPGPSPVRCWPHHFDVATYVGLEEGDFETARGIGVGMSPGDESYDQPYFYINPWPHLDAADLPALPAPGHWHTQGFVGAIATAEEVISLDDAESGMAAFVQGAFAIGREKLGV